MKYIIDNRIILSRAPEGPLAKYIVRFERAMRGQGYARYSLYRQVLLGACFSEWLRKRESHYAASPQIIPPVLAFPCAAGAAEPRGRCRASSPARFSAP